MYKHKWSCRFVSLYATSTLRSNESAFEALTAASAANPALAVDPLPTFRPSHMQQLGPLALRQASYSLELTTFYSFFMIWSSAIDIIARVFQAFETCSLCRAQFLLSRLTRPIVYTYDL